MFLQGGFWTIDKEDETFFNLMNDPSKWITNKNGKSVIRMELCEIIAEKNPDYAAKVYSRLDHNSHSAVHSNTEEAVEAILGVGEAQEEMVGIKEEHVEYKDEGVEYHEEEIVTST